MNCSKLLLVILLFNVSTLVLSCAQNPLNGDHPCPGVLEKLMDIVTAGDDPDAISQLMKGYPVGFSRESQRIIKTIIQLGRNESFRSLFSLLVNNDQLETKTDDTNSFLSEVFWSALLAHRPEICKCFWSTIPPQFHLTDFHGSLRRFWEQEAAALWTLEELLEVFPPGSSHAFRIQAPHGVFWACSTLEACMLPLEFNKRNIPSTKDGMKTCTRMLRSLLQNDSLDDEDMAALIQRFFERVKVKDEIIEEFAAARPNYPLSRQALIAVLPDKTYEGYPDDILEGLSKFSYDQFERLKQIVAIGDNPEAVGTVLGYSLFAFGKRLNEILRLMIQHNLVHSFKVLFSTIDFVHLPKNGVPTLIFEAHDFKRTQLFEYMVMNYQFVPGQFVSAFVGVDYINIFKPHIGASGLNNFIDCVGRMLAINDKVLGDDILFSSLAQKILSNRTVRDREMTALLGRLSDLGMAFDQEAVNALEQHRPDYVLTRQFLIEHLPDVKEPAE
jgi:hypothetical protein